MTRNACVGGMVSGSPSSQRATCHQPCTHGEGAVDSGRPDANVACTHGQRKSGQLLSRLVTSSGISAGDRGVVAVVLTEVHLEGIDPVVCTATSLRNDATDIVVVGADVDNHVFTAISGSSPHLVAAGVVKSSYFRCVREGA